MLFRTFWDLIPYETQGGHSFSTKNCIFMKIEEYRYYFIPICTLVISFPAVFVKLVAVPCYTTIFNIIMKFSIAVIAISLKTTIFWVKFALFSAILLVKTSIFCGKITWISLNTTMSEIINQLMRKCVNRRKITEFYSFSSIFIF